MASYPTGIATFTGFTSSHTLSQDSHAAQHNLEQGEIVATQTKIGTGASTPTSSKLLRGTGSGTSSWAQADLTTDVTGILPVGSGGLGQNSLTALPLVSPAITGTVSGGATYTNPTLTTPTVASFTNATHDHSNAAGAGQLNGANAITDGTITPNEVTSGTGSSWSWQSWAPTLTNLSGGTTNYAKYLQDGKSVDFRFKYTLAGAGVSGQVIFSLPVALNADYAATDLVNATVFFYDLSAVTPYQGSAFTVSSTTLGLRNLHTDGTRGNNEVTSSGDPFTFATGDIIYVSGTYEAA